MKKMRFSGSLIFALCLVAAVMIFPSAASAHAPSDVVLAYDAGTKVLSVTITHSSPMPSYHYIKTVEIFINGKSVMITPYTSQPGSTYTYTYTVQAANGDKLQVAATCNIIGTKTVETTIKGKTK